jgi:hypothetical protein
VIAALAIVASALPYLLFKWTSEPDAWPWPYFVEGDGLNWLRFDERPRSHGIAIQVVLAVIAVVAFAAQLALWLLRRARSRPFATERPEPAA